MTTDCKILPDVQCMEPIIKRPIKQVGVQNVTVPFTLEARHDGGFRYLTANVSMRTNLESSTKGISMSRLLRTLRKYLDRPLKQSLIFVILKDLIEKVGSNTSYMRFDFLLPIIRPSVLSNYEFPIYHKCRFEGQLMEEDEKQAFQFFQGVTVQYASYCPCSAELSRDLISKGSMGFPHAQRSFADILVKTKHGERVFLEDIIEAVENSIKTIPYPIIKREDEQEIARIAAENPIFVEDAIRAISTELDKNDAIYDWIIKCTHEESIHTSEAIAVDWKGVSGGFDCKYFL